MANGLTHFDKEGNAVMVDVSGKSITYRTAFCRPRDHDMRYRRKCQKR